MLEKEREGLIAEINRVFADMDYPKKLGSLPALADLEGKQWHELSVNDVLSNHELFFFSDEGFRYFLPGYLVVMLQNPDKMVENFIIEGILRHLCQQYTYTSKRDLCKVFDKRQRGIILKFLEIFEPLWISYEDIEKQLLRVYPNQRERARKNIEKKRGMLRDLLENAKQYWRQCDSRQGTGVPSSHSGHA